MCEAKHDWTADARALARPLEARLEQAQDVHVQTEGGVNVERPYPAYSPARGVPAPGA